MRRKIKWYWSLYQPITNGSWDIKSHEHVTSVGQRKDSESPWGIEPQTFGFRAPMLYHWATETLQWAKFMFVNRIREMVSFELGKEREKDVFYPTLVTRIKNNYLSYSIYKHDSINIADLSSMRNACHMNFEFVIDLAHHRVSVAQW